MASGEELARGTCEGGGGHERLRPTPGAAMPGKALEPKWLRMTMMMMMMTMTKMMITMTMKMMKTIMTMMKMTTMMTMVRTARWS